MQTPDDTSPPRDQRRLGRCYISPTEKMKVLYDHAIERICQIMDPDYTAGLVVDVYKALSALYGVCLFPS